VTVTTHDEELLARVREMRERGSAPKQIAKELGLRPAQATALVRRVAEAAQANIAPDERPGVGCWVNAGWSAGLDMAGAPDWAAADLLGQEPDPGAGGFAQILLARQERASKVTVTGFLVDVYCLGVKNVTDPEVMGSGSLTTYVPTYYSAFDHPPLPIGVEQAQTIVHDAVAYARGLASSPRAASPTPQCTWVARPATGPSSASGGTASRSTSPAPTTTRARWSRSSSAPAVRATTTSLPICRNGTRAARSGKHEQ
jgi:hypothetical protein